MRDQLIELGGRIKSRRKAAGLTLQELAEATGLTAGLLSKIENFRTIPSLPVLLEVARALNADLAELFAGLGVEARPKWLLVRAADRRTVEREDAVGMHYGAILERGLDAVNLQVLFVTIDSGVEREAVSGEGDEMLFIVSGELGYRLGDETVALAAGDTLFFDGGLPHAPVNNSGARVTLLACYFLKENSR